MKVKHMEYFVYGLYQLMLWRPSWCNLDNRYANFCVLMPRKMTVIGSVVCENLFYVQYLFVFLF